MRASNPPLLLTVTVTVPAPRSGALHSTRVELTYCPRELPSSPNRQLSSPLCAKCRPDTVTTCPPRPLTPHDGISPSTVAPASYRNSIPSLVKSAPPLALTSSATCTASPSTAPGATHITTVDDTHRAPAPADTTPVSPNRQRSPSSSRKPDPVTLTAVPPVSAPRDGRTPSTLGVTWYSNWAAFPILVPDDASASLISTTPGLALRGAVHTSALPLPGTAATRADPKMHSIPAPPTSRAAPVNITLVPPDTGPRLGSATQASTWVLYSNRIPPLRTLSCSSAPLLTVTVTDPVPCSGAVHTTTVELMYKPLVLPSSPNLQLSSGLCSK